MTNRRRTNKESYILHPGDGEHLAMGVWFKATADDTDGQSWVLEIVNPEPAATPLHIHRRHDEMFYVLEGTYRIQIGREVVDAPPGTFAYARRGTPHTFVSSGDGPGRLLQMGTPGGLEEFLREMDRLLAAGADESALARLLEAWDTENVGPPLSPTP